MRKLIISELKKMLKSKFHLSLLIFVIVMMVVQIVMNNVLIRYGAKSSYGSDIPLACAGMAIIMLMNMHFSVFMMKALHAVRLNPSLKLSVKFVTDVIIILLSFQKCWFLLTYRKYLQIPYNIFRPMTSISGTFS